MNFITWINNQNKIGMEYENQIKSFEFCLHVCGAHLQRKALMSAIFKLKKIDVNWWNFNGRF